MLVFGHVEPWDYVVEVATGLPPLVVPPAVIVVLLMRWLIRSLSNDDSKDRATPWETVLFGMSLGVIVALVLLEELGGPFYSFNYFMRDQATKPSLWAGGAIGAVIGGAVWRLLRSPPKSSAEKPESTTQPSSSVA